MLITSVHVFCVRMYTEEQELSKARRVRSSGAGVMYGCWVTWYGCWILDSGPLQEQKVLLIAEQSLQPPQ